MDVRDVITKITRMDRFPKKSCPWCSAVALRAPELRYSHIPQFETGRKSSNLSSRAFSRVWMLTNYAGILCYVVSIVWQWTIFIRRNGIVEISNTDVRFKCSSSFGEGYSDVLDIYTTDWDGFVNCNASVNHSNLIGSIKCGANGTTLDLDEDKGRSYFFIGGCRW